ncbi:MAG: periplasmic protein TonB [Sphingomonadales bacterium]|jgi:protein TonB|nr:periplasmic protein TonB [Sphingomonadales bacterium]
MIMDLSDPRKNDRIKAVLAAALFEGALAYALLVGLGVRPPTAVSDPLQLVGLLPERPLPPQKKIVPPPKRTPQKEGAASPPNLRAKPTEIVVPPPPPMPLPVPPPIAAAPIAGPGSAPSAGAADIRGPGTGSGGLGNGTGSGNGGNGGGGGGTGDGTPPRWLKGRVKDSDYPPGARQAGIGGTVAVRYAVEIDGHATACAVIESSGNAELDQTTCRLIEKRFRYRPATDSRGRPVRTFIEEDHTWVAGSRPPTDPDNAPDGAN